MQTLRLRKPRFNRANPLASIILLCLLGGLTARSDDPSLRKAWREAPKSQGVIWSRSELLGRLLKGVELSGMARANVLGLFGQSGYSWEASYPGSGGRVDEYRLSAQNDTSFRVDYDSADKVTSYALESSPCECAYCTANTPEIPAAVLEKSGVRNGALPGLLTMSSLERILVRPGKVYVSQNRAGGQMWLDYNEVWRVGGTPHQFLFASGHVPLRDAPTHQIGDKRVGSIDLILFMPRCLAQ